MVSIADAPEIVLLNEKQIENLFSYINEGTVREIVENSREASSSEIGIGIKKLIQLQFGSASENEDSEEKIKNVDTVGKFAVIHNNLDEAGDITRIDELSEDDHSKLSNRQYIETKGTIKPSPVNNLQNAIDEIAPLLQLMGATDEIQSEEHDLSVSDMQQFMDRINSKEHLYLQDVSSKELDANILFSLDGLSNQAGRDFPNKYTEYRVLSVVEHVYGPREKESLIEIADMFPSGRNKADKMQFMSAMAEGANEVSDGDVATSDLEISYPDIRVRPMAIYLL